MSAVQQVMQIVRGLNRDEFDELFRLIQEIDAQDWDRQLDESTQAFHAAGLTDDDVDEAVRKMRYESRP